ncbi:MAG: discoidin domain-containing protein [Lachnospiraceae bacterium]|nr:discoidin domain-containing protein [Lachnospiraceae bacterium]
MKLNTKTVLSFLISASMVFTSVVTPTDSIFANNEVTMIADDNLFASYATDLANGKNGYASSNQRQDKNYPVKVNNLTNNNTSGSNYIITHSEDTNPWFCVDLGSAQDINKVVANQGADSATYPNAYATSYVIEYSNFTGNLGGTTAEENAAYISEMTWSTASTVTGAKLGNNTSVFESVKTRYVRIRATSKYSSWASLYEMYVYGTDFSKPYNSNEQNNTDNIKILFIGNSLTEYNNVAGKVQDIFAHEGRQVQWDKLIQLGKSLEYHYSLPETGQTILNGDYDYVVLQDKASGFNGDTLMSGATKIYDNFISKTKAKVVMYSPWANESVLKATQEYVTNSYMKVAIKYNAPIAPAGEAWFDLYYNYGHHWYADNIHATNVGSFVSANAIYYAISGVTTPVKYKSSDNIIKVNGYDVNIANLIAERTCYFTTLANSNKAGYVSIAKNYVQPETTAQTPTEEVTTLVHEGEYTTGRTVNTGVFAEETNIARSKQTYASTQKQAAGFAVDGNISTRWESEFADPQWMYIDLGRSYSISKVALMWEGAYAKKYHIQVSNVGGENNSDWTTVKTVTATGVSTVEIDMNGANGRYVRMLGESRGTEYGYSIYEFGVWSNEVTEEPTVGPTETQTQIQTETQSQSSENAYYDAEGQVKDDEILGIEGFQIKTSYDDNGNATPGFRVIERVGDSKVGEQRVVKNGVLIVRADKYNRNLMTTDAGDLDGTDVNNQMLNENQVIVAVAKANPIAWTSSTHNDTNAYYNAFTMVNNIEPGNVVRSLTDEYYVRAFAQLTNGQIIYSKIYKSSLYSAADTLYKYKQMTNFSAHNYLYNEILKVVTQEYAEVDYVWSNALYRPSAQ